MKKRYDKKSGVAWFYNFRNWLKTKKLPDSVVLIILGVASTVWFLLRVIPKPSRASYPCVQAVAPIMSGFVVYLLSLSGITLIFKRLKNKNISRFSLANAGLVVLLLFFTLVNITSDTSVTSAQVLVGPEDGPNQPVGKARGAKPGVVVWAWNPDATNENSKNVVENGDWYFTPKNTNGEVVNKMVSDMVIKLGGSKNPSKSWDAIFKAFNRTKLGENKGYTDDEKIFIKINQGTSTWSITKEEQDNGYEVPYGVKEGQRARYGGPTETAPYVVLGLLRQLVNEAGVKQANIYIGDPMKHIFKHNYDVWHSEFPDINYLGISDKFGRYVSKPTEKEMLFYSDKKLADKLHDVTVSANYMINVASLKPHGSAGISIVAKNHFGSHARRGAGHLHYSLIAPLWEESPRQVGKPSNGGYKKYRVLVDLLGSKYLGGNTMLCVVDGLFGGGADETKGPVKYFMPPFNGDWSNSIFMSQDQVAIESVCYDFLRSEWNGINKHDAANNVFEEGPNMRGVDDHLHQAADPENWPEGIIYDPDNSGNPLTSLGVHEHWNNANDKQYSGNMGRKNGITLVSIPENLVKSGK
ncbi:MAG: DUF362 domain-containing protein [Bacteroidales bacterium]|jgi:hypothetical protein|nr:DUF362 domain-containing protein [Bacteroidales bacterium]